MSDGLGSLFDEDESLLPDSEHTEEQSQQFLSYIVVRKKARKKRNDSSGDHVEIECVHHRPEQTTCECCQFAILNMPMNARHVNRMILCLPS